MGDIFRRSSQFLFEPIEDVAYEPVFSIVAIMPFHDEFR